MWNRTETKSETFTKRTCDWRIRSASKSNHCQGSTTRTNGLSDQQELSKHLTFTSTSKKMPKFHCLLLPNTPSPHVTHSSESQSPGCLHATQIPGSNPFTLGKPPSGKKHLLVIEEPTQTWPLSLPLPVSKAHVSQHTLPRQPKWKKEVLQTQHPRTLKQNLCHLRQLYAKYLKGFAKVLSTYQIDGTHLFSRTFKQPRAYNSLLLPICSKSNLYSDKNLKN